MYKLIIYWLSWFLILIKLSQVDCKKLPSIWKEGETEIGSYRLAAKLELTESGKIFMLEEWTTVTKRLFRLDLIDSYSGTRRTLLSNKYTNENFYYKPFECSLVSNFDAAYYPELADKFKSNFDLLVPTGIGSLWLQSSDIDASYLVSSYNDLSKISVKTSNHVLKNYIQYKVPINGNGYPYRLDFFFRPGDESLRSLTLIHILKLSKDEKSAKVIMRIKILEIDTFKESIDSLSDFEGLFDLPVGYGCQRGEFYDRSFAVPVNRFMPNYVPHVLQLDIVSTQPIDSSHDTNKWKNHEVSVRIVTGRLKSNNLLSNDYIILETQDFALRPQSLPTISNDDIKKTAFLRRRKRVWDLGMNGLTSKDTQKRAKFFEIDERTRQCLNFGENKLSESASIEFGISSNENASPSNSDNTQAKVVLSLNTELIDTLFTSTQDYHLIREDRLQSYPHIRETIYERRVNKFQLKDSEGNVVWSGPVSFIRKHSRRLKSDVMHQTSSGMHFYSNDLTKLVGKIHMIVIERRTISEAYLHRELEDIGKLCFAKMLSSQTDDKLKWYYKEKPDFGGSLDFVVSYPIESKDTAEKLSMVNSIDEVLYKEFMATMFAVSKDRLNFLQLSDIDIDFGPDMVKISAEISEMPSLLNFWQDCGQKFSESKKNLLFTEKNILNEELCAKSCLYYNCFMFSYCSNTKICDILLTKVENSSSSSNNRNRGGIVMTFESDSSCSIFRPQTNQDNSKDIKNFIKPNELIQNLQQTILSSKGEDENNALRLEFLYLSAKQEKLEINLTPMFITSGNFSSEKEGFGNLLGEEKEKKVSDNNNNNQFKAEYKIVFENRRFKDTLKISQDFPLQLAQHTSYDDCKLLCSETDCHSFSHCKIESTCRVSMLHKTKLIIDFSEEEDLCVISSRDYSSKFKQTLNDKHILKLRNVSKTLIAGSENDCAIDCMEEEKFKCKSFYYCPRQQQQQQQGKEEEEDEAGDEFNCYLRKTHLAVENKLPAINKTIFQANQRKCYLYTRSYLADFDKFFGLSLSELIDGKHDEDISEVIHNSSAEECAIQCANHEGDCEAFQVCRSDNSYEPTCTFLTKLISSSKKLSLDSSQLVGDDRCTSFLISPKSEFSNFYNSKEESDGSEISIISENNLEKTGHLFIRFILFLIGLTLGYLVTVLLMKRRRLSLAR